MSYQRRAFGRPFVWVLGLVILVFGLAPLTAADDAADLGKVVPEVLTPEQRKEASGMIDRDINRRSTAVNARNRDEWAKITTREQWEKFRDERVAALRRSLGDFPAAPVKLNVRTTGTVDGDGFKIENTVFESRPGQWVAGNLYVPAKPSKSMPGILIAHAHHGGKRDSELQDMGMTWARAGCLVLVIDQVGYGERRSHPFNSAEDYAKQYRTGRQDYFFRQDTGVQLQLMGDSLMGWMVWDLMRGVDLLLARDGIDPKRIAILGAVAGGGDPAGVTAALDRRIACCVPFNFGGPQPESRYPLPDDSETSFNYLGGSYWDSTRGLRLGGRDDFLHWVIVASTAPRRLIHAHEFSWDQEHDPVWKRYQKIWGEFYKDMDSLGFAHGTGTLKGRPPEASHCNNIGKIHRRLIHPLFERWFDIKVAEKDEYSAPRKPTELVCLTDKAREELKPKGLNELMSAVGQERIDAARKRLAGKTPDERRQLHRDDWSKLLGPVTPAKPPVVKASATDEQPAAGAKVERIVLEVEPGIVVPVLVLTPAKMTGRAPVVVGLAQSGKAGFLKERAGELEKLVKGGTIVVLPDLRGTGDTRAGDTDLSTNLQLFGETLLGQRLRDLRSVLTYVRERKDVDTKRVALWGDAFAPTNPADTNFKVPRGVEGWPRGPEPLGGQLALLGGLFDDDIRAVYLAGGLSSHHGVLTHFAVLIPHSASVPGALTTGDLCDLAGSLAPRPLRLEALVDHRNQPVTADAMKNAYDAAVQSYSAKPQALSLAESRSSAAAWLLEQLR
ncbi:MAG: acetylxylan esterase [Gemmataceae bacterium]|nr:acetylxylan esterase [Gemmataceae bacterium]